MNLVHFQGMEISAKPARGPEANHLTSLAIFIKSPANAFNVPCNPTTSSCAVSAWILFQKIQMDNPYFLKYNVPPYHQIQDAH